MSPEMDQVRLSVAETRARLSETTEELQAAVSRKVEAVNPLHYAREYPWIALGLAVGAGLAIGLSGADDKVASAAAEGVKKAGPAIADAAVSAKDAVVEKFSSDETAVVESEPRQPGLRAQAASAIHDLLQEGLDEILGALGVTRPST